MHWKKLKDLREQESKEPDCLPTILLCLPSGRLRWRPLTHRETYTTLEPAERPEQDRADSAHEVQGDWDEHCREKAIGAAEIIWLSRLCRLGLMAAPDLSKYGLRPGDLARCYALWYRGNAVVRASGHGPDVERFLEGDGSNMQTIKPKGETRTNDDAYSLSTTA